MNRSLLLAFAALFLTGCEIFSDGSGNRDLRPQRMVSMVLQFKTDDPGEQERNILITTTTGLFNSAITQRDPDAPDMAGSQLFVTGRVFSIDPGAVRLEINVKMMGTSRNVGFEQSVTPVPGQKLLLHHEGLQTFFLTVFVIPGADDPERENILKLSPPDAVAKILKELREEQKSPNLPGTEPSKKEPKDGDKKPGKEDKPVKTPPTPDQPDTQPESD